METKTVYHNNGIPDHLYRAFCKSRADYDPGMLDTFMSASSINSPPWQFWLRQKKVEKMFEDKPVPITSAYKSIQGDAIHSLLEKAYKGDPDYVLETRVYYDMKVGEQFYTISGKFDVLQKSSLKLSDYKQTSIKNFHFLDGDIYKKEDAILQINTLKFLLKYGYILIKKDEQYFKRKTNIDIKDASVYLFIEGWDYADAMYGRNRMPKLPCYEYPVRTASYDDIGNMIKNHIIRMLKHKDLNVDDESSDMSQVCSYEDRWQKPSTFPVFKKYKNGNTNPDARALPGTASFATQREAENFIENHKEKELLYYEHRKEEPKRCSMYCDINMYCKFWKQFQNS